MLCTKPRDGNAAEEAPRLTLYYLAVGTDLVPMHGETTGIAGLLFGPAVGGSRNAFTRHWMLIHRPDGTRIGTRVTQDLPYAYAREAVLWLAGRDLDWNRPAEQVRRDPRAKDLQTELHGAFMAAQGLTLAEPLFYARTSWLPAPPPWRIWQSDRPAGDAFATFEAAAAEADLHEPDPDLTVRRDDASPGWTLRCAAPLCGDGSPAWLTVDDDTPLHGARDALTADACVLDWARASRQHWLCPDCVRDHQR
ncbi:hypothetical protein [Amycolatopsis sp. NPDC004079]|uniref:hypothetical protein n=1 Tax=Amycolatopsis sp. NPDC004079 TaxID=3154549 RepID=UPI0033A204FB